MTKQETLENIIESYINGNQRQMVQQIDEYGLYDFWQDLADCYESDYAPFVEMTIAYFRIKNR